MPRFALVILVLLAAGAAAAEPVNVANKAQPAHGVVTAQMHEIWRAGGDDDEVFFGNIATVKTDVDGNTLLLDGQLAEVHRIGPDGEHLGIIGQEGDGPGEVRRPNDLFIMGDGTICVLQGFPGRVVKLHPDGTPAGEATFSLGDGSQGQFCVLVRGLDSPQGMVLAGIRMGFGGGSQSAQNYFLAECDDEGRQLHALVAKKSVIDYAELVLDEMAMDFVWGRVAAGPDGRVIVAPERNAMRFQVFTAGGDLERTFTRDYAAGTRDDAQRERAHRIIAAVGANYPAPPREITVEDREPAVTGMWATADGYLWVQAGHQDTELPAGTWTQLDVYDPEGHFERQVALSGDHNPDQDSLTIQPDGRCVVIVGALDAFLNQQAVSSESDENSDSPSLEVICYRVEL